MPMCTPMHTHAANMPGMLAENGAANSVLAASSSPKPSARRPLRVPTPLPLEYRPVVSAVSVVASIVADANIGSIALGTVTCMPVCGLMCNNPLAQRMP